MSTKTWSDMRGDILDSRDIVLRLDELRGMDERDEDEAEELTILETLADEDYLPADWQYGETFIPDDRFEDYARELAEDIGALPRDAQWPATYIDWPAAANALKMDYTSYTIDGIEYWARS